MAYERYYPGGWKNKPNSNTYLHQDALNHMEDGIEVAHEAIDGRLSDANLNATYVRGEVADAKYAPRVATQSPMLVVGTRSKTGNARSATAPTSSLSDGSVQAETIRYRHFATCDAHSIRLVYGNITMGEPGPNPITVKAAVQYSTGDQGIVPVYFNGSRTVTIQPGGIAVSDPVPLDLYAGVAFYTRQRVSVTEAGQKWPIGPRVDTSVGDGMEPTDVVDAGNPATGHNTFRFGPTAIVGVPVATGLEPTWFLLGDSIVQGVGDTGGEPVMDAGWPARGLANNYGYINAGRAGEEAGQFQPGRGRLLGRLQLAAYCTHALVNYGVNDIKGNKTAAQIKGYLETIWAMLDRMGIAVYQSTITPITDNTGTTPLNAAQEAVRVEVNNWIRTTPGLLSGYFDAADASETARNSGAWKSGYSTDGTHPNSTGGGGIAAAFGPFVAALS
ncbi:SGNH/GDSL hydrolase family protein [Rhodococcus pyridinivorans]|uniref:SGNH/GDSL hydrolase family protein n=1 Tax=Rhodococcus pyridinivorans TaxID=103816 RepID=A0A7M2XNV5_9NOCA|nr:SGNH/GDSL hydrolase family protein [Rhodococcus pyridinivorans]QOV99508.1 SGNH/GDSL hydrolase family protein [Rhodococcus pyridinivorans]